MSKRNIIDFLVVISIICLFYIADFFNERCRTEEELLKMQEVQDEL